MIITSPIPKKTKAVPWLLLLVFIIACQPLSAQDVSVQAQIDKQKIIIGDQLILKHTMEYNPLQFKLQLPHISDTFNKFELVERLPLDSSGSGDKIKLIQQSVLTHFDSGRHIIPSHKFIVTPLDNSPSYEIQTDSIAVFVSTIAVDTSKPILPIYEIIEAKKPWWEYLITYGGGLLIFVLLGLIVYFIIKRSKNKQAQTPIPKKKTIAPWDAAQTALQELIAKEGWLTQNEKQHHTQLTDIIRTYIEDVFDLDCFEKTSQEIITDVKKYLQQNNYKKRQEELEKLRTIFFTADMVKFAKSKPTELEHLASNQAALSFVKSTSIFVKENIKKNSDTSN